MIKKINVLLLIFVMLASVMPTVALAADTVYVDVAAPEFSTSDTDNDIYTYFNGNLTSGRYCLSYDYTTSTQNQVYVRLHEQSTYYAHNNYVLLILQNNKIRICRDFGTGYYADKDLDSEYQKNTSYHFEIWVDKTNREIEVFVNNERLAVLPVPKTLNMKGFSIYSYGTDERDGNSVYSNLKFFKQDDSVYTKTSPLYIKAEAPNGIIGNNFFKDKPVEFKISAVNRLSTAVSGSISYRTYVDETGEEIWSTSEDFSYLASESKVFTIKPETVYYGRLNLDIKVTVGGEEYVKTVPYTMSNRSADMPLNKKVGLHSGIRMNRSNPDISIPLQATAGIGALRDELVSWPSVEQQKGVYSFTADHEHKLDLVDKYDLYYMNLFGYGNTAVYPNSEGKDSNIPESQDALQGLESFMTKYMEFADGRVDAVEVWNEYHNFAGAYNTDYTKSAPMHKAVYDGVEAGDPNVTVVGVATDNYGLKPSNWTSQWTDYGQGSGEFKETIKAFKNQAGDEFDAISIHPYTNGQPPEKSDGYLAKSPEWAHEILDDNGYGTETPLYFSEAGLSEANVNYDRAKHAAYFVRNIAYTNANDLAEIIFMHCFHDYGSEKNKTGYVQGYYGITESYDTYGAEIPYLGKEAFSAYAYYNALMAEAKSFTNHSLNSSSVYAYDITDRNNFRIIMLGSVDGDSRQVTIDDISEDYVYVADMYGNEVKTSVADGSLILSLTDEPVYVIFDNGKQEKLPDDGSADNLYAIIEGKADYEGQDVLISIYNEGFSPETLLMANPTEAVYYWNQMTAGREGKFAFLVKLGSGISQKTAYVYAGDETYTYKLGTGTGVSSVMNGDAKDSALVTYVGERPDMFRAIYHDGVLTSIETIASGDLPVTGNLNKIEINAQENRVDYLERIFVWKKDTLIPLSAAINLQ